MPLTLSQYYANYGKPASAGVAKIIERYSKLAPLLPIRSTNDLNFNFGRETSLGDVGRRLLNQPAPTNKPGTVLPDSEPLVMLTRRVQTDHRQVKMNVNSRGDEIARGTRAIAREMDDLLINGNPDVSDTDIAGLKVRATGEQLIAKSADGDAYDLDYTQKLLDLVVDQGAGKLLVMNKATARAHKKAILGEAGAATVADANSEQMTYEGARIIVMGDKLDDTPVIGFNETHGTDTECTSVYCVAPGAEDVELSGVRIIQASDGIEVVQEGIRDSFYIDVVEVAMGLVSFDKRSIARYQGITRSVP